MEFEKIKTLYKIKDKSFGYSIYEIEQKEKKLNSKLPKALVDLYHHFGKNKRIFSNQSPRNLEELFINDEGYLELYLCNQSGNRWSIKPKEGDTQLYFKPLGKEWHYEHVSIKDFFLSQIYWASCTRLGFYATCVSTNEEIEKKLSDKILKKLKIDSRFLNLEFYQISPNDILANNDNSIWFGSNNKADLGKIMSMFEDKYMFTSISTNTFFPKYAIGEKKKPKD